MSIVIRAAEKRDLGLILDFIRGLAEYEKLAHECIATEEALSATLFGPKPAAEVLIAEIDEKPVGFSLFFTSYSTFLAKPGIWLEDLFVLPEYRGRGAGKAMLARLAALVEERGWGRLEWVVLDWNQPAIDFYRSLGAEPQEEWTTWRMTGESLTRMAEGVSGAD